MAPLAAPLPTRAPAPAPITTHAPTAAAGQRETNSRTQTLYVKIDRLVIEELVSLATSHSDSHGYGPSGP